MTSERFKEIYERNRHNSIVMLYEVFIEEKGNTIDLQTFNSNLNIWLTLVNFGDINGGMIKVVEYLKNKYK